MAPSHMPTKFISAKILVIESIPSIRYHSEVMLHSLATLLLDSQHLMLFSLQVLAQILRESRPTSCTRLAELDHSRVCQLCHLSDEFEYFTAARSLAGAILVWLDLCKRVSLDNSSFSYEFRVNHS